MRSRLKWPLKMSLVPRISPHWRWRRRHKMYRNFILYLCARAHVYHTHIFSLLHSNCGCVCVGHFYRMLSVVIPHEKHRLRTLIINVSHWIWSSWYGKSQMTRLQNCGERNAQTKNRNNTNHLKMMNDTRRIAYGWTEVLWYKLLTKNRFLCRL